MRLLAIGDIHGCRQALDSLLAFVNPLPGEMIITLGDYVDRGQESKGVINRLIELHSSGSLVPLRGNHEIMMLNARNGEGFDFWMQFGGDKTLESYGESRTLNQVPAKHWDFLTQTCIDWYESESHLFVHANADPALPMSDQSKEILHWEGIGHWHQPHVSGKQMICGHVQQASGKPLNLGSAVCINTGACYGGWLTCLDVTTGSYWQANELGETRMGILSAAKRRS